MVTRRKYNRYLQKDFNQQQQQQNQKIQQHSFRSDGRSVSRSVETRLKHMKKK